ncbi:MAG: hypothetical protein OEU54_00625 [Gemmatimonadota bacterium]|nr:hypothetical protein [Gemmatimonadota bacterium]
MSSRHDIRAFDYVNHPYERVREALRDDTERVLQQGTRAAASRAHAVASLLHVNIGGFEVGTEISLNVSEIDLEPGSGASGERTRIRLDWKAAKNPRLFPEMTGVLSVYALTAKETQLDFEGTYETPLGPLGTAVEAIIGRRIADASVHRFVTDVAVHLRETLRSDA